MQHKERTYRQAKGVIRCQTFKPADATVDAVLASVSTMIDVPQEVISSLKRQLSRQPKLIFTDFLLLLQKEAFFRETLAEYQLYRLSA